MATAWQSNLRKSDGIRQIGAKNDVISKKLRPRLSSVTETGTDDVFGDENAGKKISNVPRVNRRKLSTQGSVSEVDNVSKEVKEQKTPVKVLKAYSFLRPIPTNLPGDDFQVKNIPSPIPLPKGVINIDHHDDSCQIYGRDIFNYVVIRDARFVVTSKDISSDIDAKIEERREHLVDWLMSVSHHYKCSQETLYHTVDILDRCLSKAKFKTEHLQLLGITSFLLATKLDEYHPGEINELCRLTENSVTPIKILVMEHKILETINFEAYGTEPMTFIRRYLKAAQFLQNSTVTYELSILFMDAMVSTLWEDAEDASTAKKAAVAVFTALVIRNVDLDDSNAVQKIWTPNMIYYVWPNYLDLVPMSRGMLRSLAIIMKDSKNEFALTSKYKSVSRHAGLLEKLSYGRVIDVKAFIETL